MDADWYYQDIEIYDGLQTKRLLVLARVFMCIYVRD
jgi:hypothetical protein